MLNMVKPYEFSLPIIVKFGSGESRKIGAIAKERGWRKTLIITDKGVADAGLLKGITESLEESSISYKIYDEVEPNPKSIGVEKAVRLLKDLKCDFAIGVGGGSAMDSAKVATMLARNPGKPKDYAQWAGQSPKVFDNHPLPLVTIPTTAGTGSEVDFWAGITDSTEMRKMDLGQSPLYPGGPYLGATIAIIDPLLTLTLPRKQTAATGMDALLHAIGAYVSSMQNPHVWALAQYSIELVAKNLPIAYSDGASMQAREGMILAANLSGICMNYVPILGADHALGLALGDIYHNTTHGIGCTIFAPVAMEFNLEAEPSKYARIAALMSEKTNELSVKDASSKAVEALRKLIHHLEMPTTLKQIGVKKEDLPKIARNATQKVDIEGNPRTITYDDLLRIVEQVYE
jgi:alcohol dehydrogenase class IV